MKNKNYCTRTKKYSDSEIHTQSLQHHLSELQFLTFHYAVKAIDSAAHLNPSASAQEFSNAFEAYQLTSLINDNLEQSGRAVKRWTPHNHNGLTKEDLFKALQPFTQDLLRQQGISYE